MNQPRAGLFDHTPHELQHVPWRNANCWAGWLSVPPDDLGPGQANEEFRLGLGGQGVDVTLRYCNSF